MPEKIAMYKALLLVLATSFAIYIIVYVFKFIKKIKFKNSIHLEKHESKEIINSVKTQRLIRSLDFTKRASRKQEYDKVVTLIIENKFHESKDLLINELIPNELKTYSNEKKEISQKDLFELVFKVSTSYIKNIFDIFGANVKMTNGEKLILYNLYEIHQTFILGLFTNRSEYLVNEFSNSYQVILILKIGFV